METEQEQNAILPAWCQYDYICFQAADTFVSGKPKESMPCQYTCNHSKDFREEK